MGNPILDGGRPTAARIAGSTPTPFGRMRQARSGPWVATPERGSGIATVDFSLFKSFPMPFSEKHKVEFRGEVFNMLNLGNPKTARSSAIFGRISSAADPRILQLGLRYSF